MRLAFLVALGLLAAGCSVQGEAGNAKADNSFPALTGRVVDQADLLPPALEQRLAAASAALEREVGPQLVVATVATLEGQPIEIYSIGLARHWGIGHPERRGTVEDDPHRAERRVLRDQDDGPEELGVEQARSCDQQPTLERGEGVGHRAAIVRPAFGPGSRL